MRLVADDEFPGLNSWFLARIRPDGTGMAMFSGFRLDREATQSYRPSFGQDGETVALFIPVSPRIANPGPNGVRYYDRGPSLPRLLMGPQTFDGVRPSDISFASAEVIESGTLLVTARSGEDGDHDVFLYYPQLDQLVPLSS